MDVAAALEDRVKHGALRVAAAPLVALTVLRSTSDERAAHQSLRHMLERTPPLAEVVLRLANTARFRWGADVHALQHAVVVLGRRALRSVSVATEVHQWTFAGARPWGLPLRRRAWRLALTSASLASWLAPRFELSPEEAFQVTLFHDLGRVAVIGALERLVDQQGLTLPFSEQWALVERHQVELGLRLAKLWSLPAPMTAAIARAGHDVVAQADQLTAQLEQAPLVTGPQQVLPLVHQLAVWREPVVAPAWEEVLVADVGIPGRGVVLNVDAVVTEAVVHSATASELVVDASLELERLVFVGAGPARFYAVVRSHDAQGSRLVPWALTDSQAEQWRQFVDAGFEDVCALALGA